MPSSHAFGLTGYAAEPGEATLEIEDLDPKRRLARGLRTFALWTFAAVVCVFIPIAHFVLVPFCLIMAFVMLAVRMGQKRMVVKARGRCPDCGTVQDLDLLGPWKGRADLSCASCRRPMRLSS